MNGPTPPQLTFKESREHAILFNKLIDLYVKVTGDIGNKPYYPYFIYKGIENLFHDNKDKLKLLDYIHLQNIKTVINHDKTYKEMVKISDPLDNIRYEATDPCKRI
jgi:hypothetical protein